jgi:transcriptional regulator with XRE-family HTH domain
LRIELKKAYFLSVRPNGPAQRAIREAQEMSLRLLERITGLDRGYLSRIERGQIRHVADPSVQKIADALRVPTEAITHKEKT